MMIDGRFYKGKFVENTFLPAVKVGDMVSFKYGEKGKKYKVLRVRDWFEEREDGKTYHWMMVKVEGYKKYIQGDYVIIE